MASTQALTGLSEKYKLPEVIKDRSQSMGKDEFLKLLITQLQNQDPSSPMENAEMMQQMATLAQMESISQMANAAIQSQTYALIGKAVTGTFVNEETGDRTPIIGNVDSAGIQNGKPYVLVGDVKLLVENITQVFDPSIISGSGQAASNATGMVGRYIRANIGTADQPQYVEGLVTRWISANGAVSVTVDGRDIPLMEVVAVADTEEALGDIPAKIDQTAPEPKPESAEV